MTADNVIPLVPTDTLDRQMIADLRHVHESIASRGIDATWIERDELRALLRAADERDALAARLERITAPTTEIIPIAAEPDDEPEESSRCRRCKGPITPDGRTLFGWRHTLPQDPESWALHDARPEDGNPWRIW